MVGSPSVPGIWEGGRRKGEGKEGKEEQRKEEEEGKSWQGPQ